MDTTILNCYELLTNNLTAGVIIRDPAGKILYVSPYTEVLTGFPLASIAAYPGDFLASVIAEKDKERYQRARSICDLGEDILVRCQITHRSGIPLWIETHLVPVTNQEGNTEATMSVSVDVTATINYQRQIEEQNRDLNDFTYMVSHDLKAPIFTVKGMASALREDYGKVLDQEGLELVEYILDATNRLDALIKSLLEYSTVSTKQLKQTPVSLETLLQDILQDQSEEIRRSSANIVVDSPLPTVQGEPVRLYQVFSNLIGNALKYGAPGRVPIVQIKLEPSAPHLLAISISDNGMGIPEGKLEDIFRPFVRLHSNTREGNGIGLACVRKIVERLGGHVNAQSTEGEGSTFTVTLPRDSNIQSPDKAIDY